MEGGAALGSALILIWALCVFAMLGAVLLSVVWVYRDAEKRGKTGCLWILIAFFTWPLGVIAYFMLRDKEVRL